MPEDKTLKILDAEHFLESANNSVRHLRNVYLAYLAVMIYILIIILSTDQELLFRSANTQLPLVYISVPIIVPIVEFFVWMPWAFLILHFYLLIQMTFLSEKVRLYEQRLNDHLISREDIRKAQTLLTPMPLVHILAEEKTRSTYSILLYLMVFVSLAVFPLVLLIMTQMKFLPYQNEGITLAHRIVVMIDIGLLWCFGLYVFKSHGEKWFKNIWKSVITLILTTISIFTIIFIFGCLYIPNDKINTIPLISECPFNFDRIVEEKLNFSNYFNLPNRMLVKKELAPELLATRIKEQINDENLISIRCRYADPLDLKDRNFREARLREAALCKAILQNADLTSADLRSANLTSADLFRANLTSADLRVANLKDASLGGANLTSASLRVANLTSADLRVANLTSADLRVANLTDASLRVANLTSASLEDANLTSADLTAVNLSETNFSNAVLAEAILDFTWVWESSSSKKEANFPTGIPRGWSDTLKPEYLCPDDFDVSGDIDISEYINKDDKVEREKLQKQLGEVIKKECERYYP